MNRFTGSRDQPSAFVVSARDNNAPTASLWYYGLDPPAKIVNIVDDDQPFVVSLRLTAEPSKHCLGRCICRSLLLIVLVKAKLCRTSFEARTCCFIVCCIDPEDGVISSFVLLGVM